MSGLAQMYLDGSGIPQDEAKGVSWYRRAADAGDGLAMNNVGVFYREALHGFVKNESGGGHMVSESCGSRL